MGVFLPHFSDYLLGFFGAEVRLIVLLVGLAVGFALLLAPLHLHLNEILVLPHRLIPLRDFLTHLVLLVLNRIYKLVLFGFP